LWLDNCENFVGKFKGTKYKEALKPVDLPASLSAASHPSTIILSLLDTARQTTAPNHTDLPLVAALHEWLGREPEWTVIC